MIVAPKPVLMVNGEVPWYRLSDAVRLVSQLDHMDWLHGNRFKYVSLRIDTRTMSACIEDRDGLVTTAEELIAHMEKRKP